VVQNGSINNESGSGPAAETGHMGGDFWKFWSGQTVSTAGTAVTRFALPLLVYQLTGSALSLAVTTVATYLPYLLFGLILGAWADRVDRKALMILTDLTRALLILTIPIAHALHVLRVEWIYLVIFITSTLSIAFTAGSFAAVPRLVNDPNDLIRANGRLQASFATASLLAPLVAGLALLVVAVPLLLLADAASFLVSGLSLYLITTEFRSGPRIRSTIREDIWEGLRHVLRDPLLRSLALLTALLNVFLANTLAQIVFLAKTQLHATNSEIGWLYSAGSVGVILFSATAARLRRRFSFGQVALGSMILNGLVTIVLGIARTPWIGFACWATVMGTITLFGINTASLRQAITPNHLLGRVVTVAQVLAWSVEPAGALLGGLLIERSRNVGLLYGVAGTAIVLVATGFWASPLTRMGRDGSSLTSNS
jgi:MFS family permease